MGFSPMAEHFFSGVVCRKCKSDKIKILKTCSICEQCNEKNTISQQDEIMMFIKSEKPSLLLYADDRQIIPPYEIDIVIPDRAIAIELNGNKFHIESDKKPANYHLFKSVSASKEGYKLIQIFQDEWIYKKDAVKSYILQCLKIYKKLINHNHCKVTEISKTEKIKFLKENHILGDIESDHNIGLVYKDKLVALLPFKKNGDNILIERFCFKKYTYSEGAMEFMFNYIIETFNIKRIEVISDLRLETGDTYQKLGFKICSVIKPKCSYISKENALLRKQIVFDKTRFEKIFDCGGIKYGIEV